MKKLILLLLICSATAANALDPNHFTVNRVTAPYFIVDGNSPATITTAYVGFEVINNSNSATTYNGLKFTITSIGTSVVGQNYALVSPANGITNIGTLAPGQSKVCYYYVSYPANTTPQATFNVQLSDNSASGKTLTFNVRNRSSISANAGGTATQSFTNQDIIGGLVYDDVTYTVGNVQNNDESDFQVAVSSQFDPTKLLLLSTQVTASTVPGIPVGSTDSLYFITGNGSVGATITVRWTFRISGVSFTNYLLPCAGSTSGGTNYKYTLNTALGSGSPVTISPAANPLTITKTSDHPLYGVNATSIFTVTITNPGAYGVTIDKIVDEIPSGFSFIALDPGSDVTVANSTSIPASSATGTVTFEGGTNSYYVGSGGTLILKYSCTTAPISLSNLLTHVKDYVGTTEVGSAQNTVATSSTLPVTIVSFSGNLVKNYIKLDWTYADEAETREIVIERSTGNEAFRNIGSMNITTIPSHIRGYSFIDSFPAEGMNRYRLKFVYPDDQYQRSFIISVEGKETGLAVQSVYPNPFREQISVQWHAESAETVVVRLLDMNGRVAFQTSLASVKGNNNYSVGGLDKLVPGYYAMQIVTSAGVLQQKLVKSR